jgi:hypothetical protein
VERVEHLEQRLAQLGEVVVEAAVQARVEERHALEQALHVRVVALARLELQARRDLRVARAELGAEPPEVGELLLVVVQQVVARPAGAHAPASRPRAAPASRTS